MGVLSSFAGSILDAFALPIKALEAVVPVGFLAAAVGTWAVEVAQFLACKA